MSTVERGVVEGLYKALAARAVADDFGITHLKPQDIAAVERARGKLLAFYAEQGLIERKNRYFRFDDESKSLVPFEPASSLRVKQDGWGYRG